MSLYADYLKERTDDQIVETDYGFATYRFLDEKQVYIVDIYIVPEKRRHYLASAIADIIVERAKAKGCVEVFGSVVPSAKNSDVSMKALLGYGMKPIAIKEAMVIFKKDI
jgi:ribosomal protein S18 acetylase RimI-like enzyme